MPTTDKLALVKQLVQAAKNNLETANQLLVALGAPETATPGSKPAALPVMGIVQHTDQGAVIIEGVFDGQNMVGPDGKLYSVPANYASKSKLVEGDLLKLTISPDGSFIYKQIGPVERERLVGVLVKDTESDDYRVLAQARYYRVLLASITYFKAEIGDEVVILVPKGTTSSWAAVENVIKKIEAEGSDSATVAKSPVTSSEITPPAGNVKSKAASARATKAANQTIDKFQSASQEPSAKPVAEPDASAAVNKTRVLPPFEI